MPRQNITFATFDIRPIDPATGRVDLGFINSRELTVNLSVLNKNKKIIPSETTYSNILPVKTVPLARGKEEVLQELQKILSESVDFTEEIGLFGGRLIDSPARLHHWHMPFLVSKKEEQFDFNYLSGDPEGVASRPYGASKSLEEFRDEFSKMFSGHAASARSQPETKLLSPPPYLPWGPEAVEKELPRILDLSPAARELDVALNSFRESQLSIPLRSETAVISHKTADERVSKPLIYFSLFIAVTFALTFVLVRSLNLKNNILQRSNQAYINLNSVKDNLSEFKFSEAASSFTLAARNFELLYDDLKKVSSVFSLLDKITLGGISDVSSLIKAGELISEAGLDLSNALEKISGVNLISVIQDSGQTSILKVLNEFRLNLVQASRNLNQAAALIENSDSTLIPESERKKFEEFKSRLPEFNIFIEKAISYSDTLMVILGQSGSQRYILLFQNTSELRPTGGFPGSYALIEFDKGLMEKFFVDDIYNPDGQMKEKIIPPLQLQKVTPNWGMRDANWFVDFSSSAKKVAEFYYKDTGILVDGVMAVNVDLVPEILKITGPIQMQDFELTLNFENFIAEVQKEVEYERTRGENQPKQVLVEFAPKLLEKLSNLNREDWMKVFTLLVSSIEEKDILAYFIDGRLQSFALDNGFAGEIKQTDSDYLMITHTNIMGSKTDAVIDNFVSLDIEKDSKGNLIHTLEIKRKHKGGELGFYNKKNNDYLRVLLPEDAELININGNDTFEINQLIDYRRQGFVSDPDLERYESRVKKVGDIEILSEGGKKVFAFWMSVEPGQTKITEIKYKTSGERSGIYIQKQPGLKSEFKLIFDGETLFEGGLNSDKDIVF